MPIYEYRCRKCDENFERILFRREEKVKCPVCRSTRTEQLISSFAVNSSESGGCREPRSCASGQFR